MATRFSSLAGRLPRSTSNPTNPAVGEEYYNTTNNTWMRYDGANWLGVSLIPGGTTTSTTTTSSSTTTTSSSTTTTVSTSTSSSTTTTSSSTTTTSSSTSTTTTV